jgi:acid ceramidase
LIGCTAFACDTPDGPIHARNLDCWTEDRILGRLTCVVRVQGAAAGPYELVSWPGFIGALSGLAPSWFAISLNAVISSERPTLAPPVVLLIRRAFETCGTFAEAISLLERSPIAADCLLLVTGTKSGEMAVIERTSMRSAVRGPEDGFVAVTNDYRRLDTAGTVSGNHLQETACGRFDWATELLGRGLPLDAPTCLRILADPAVRMSITVQQGDASEHWRAGRADPRLKVGVLRRTVATSKLR